MLINPFDFSQRERRLIQAHSVAFALEQQIVTKMVNQKNSSHVQTVATVVMMSFLLPVAFILFTSVYFVFAFKN